MLQGNAGPQQEAYPGQRSPVPPTLYSVTLEQGIVCPTIRSRWPWGEPCMSFKETPQPI